MKQDPTSPAPVQTSLSKARQVTLDRVAGLVLAGGQSTRMGGQNKALSLINGKNLLSHSLERLTQNLAPNQSMAIASGTHVYALTGWPAVTQLTDRGEDGPLAGIAEGLKWLIRCKTGDYLAVIPCDSPRIPCDWLAQLIRHLPASPIAAAYTIIHGQPHFAHSLWHVDTLKTLEAQLNLQQLALGAALKSVGGLGIDLSHCYHPDDFANINTPDTLRAFANRPISHHQ